MIGNTDRKGTAQRARVYRFRDCLAISFVVSDGATGEESTETVYIPEPMVECIAHQLPEFVRDFARHNFGPGSEFKPRTVTAEGRRIDE